jgi:hypothetical protein
LVQASLLLCLAKPGLQTWLPMPHPVLLYIELWSEGAGQVAQVASAVALQGTMYCPAPQTKPEVHLTHASALA